MRPTEEIMNAKSVYIAVHSHSGGEQLFWVADDAEFEQLRVHLAWRGWDGQFDEPWSQEIVNGTTQKELADKYWEAMDQNGYESLVCRLVWPYSSFKEKTP